MMRNGESEVADYLVDKYKCLVRQKSRALYLAGGDQEDLIQEGMLGLFKAIQGYQEERPLLHLPPCVLTVSCTRQSPCHRDRNISP